MLLLSDRNAVLADFSPIIKRDDIRVAFIIVRQRTRIPHPADRTYIFTGYAGYSIAHITPAGLDLFHQFGNNFRMLLIQVNGLSNIIVQVVKLSDRQIF